MALSASTRSSLSPSASASGFSSINAVNFSSCGGRIKPSVDILCSSAGPNVVRLSTGEREWSQPRRSRTQILGRDWRQNVWSCCAKYSFLPLLLDQDPISLICLTNDGSNASDRLMRSPLVLLTSSTCALQYTSEHDLNHTGSSESKKLFVESLGTQSKGNALQPQPVVRRAIQTGTRTG